jgi:hypothetical protein
MFGYTGPCEFNDVIVIVLIGEPLAARVALAAGELVAPAESASATAIPAVASTAGARRRVDDASLLFRLGM